MSRTFLRACVVVSSSLQLSLVFIPLLNLPTEGRGPIVLALGVALFLMIGGVGLVAQAWPTFREAAIIVNAVSLVLTIPQNLITILGVSSWGTMTTSELTVALFALAWGGSGAGNVMALILLKARDSHGNGKSSALDC